MVLCQGKPRFYRLLAPSLGHYDLQVEFLPRLPFKHKDPEMASLRSPQLFRLTLI